MKYNEDGKKHTTQTCKYQDSSERRHTEIRNLLPEAPEPDIIDDEFSEE